MELHEVVDLELRHSCTVMSEPCPVHSGVSGGKASQSGGSGYFSYRTSALLRIWVSHYL